MYMLTLLSTITERNKAMTIIQQIKKAGNPFSDNYCHQILRIVEYAGAFSKNEKLAELTIDRLGLERKISENELEDVLSVIEKTMVISEQKIAHCLFIATIDDILRQVDGTVLTSKTKEIGSSMPFEHKSFCHSAEIISEASQEDLNKLFYESFGIFPTFENGSIFIEVK